MISAIGKRAFSLVELIVTVAVLSVGIAVVLQALAFSSRVTGLSCDITNAVFLAEDKIQELEFKERQDTLDKEEREAEDRERKFDWKYTLTTLDDLNLYKLNLDIIWQRLNREERLNLTTYLRNEP